MFSHLYVCVCVCVCVRVYLVHGPFIMTARAIRNSPPERIQSTTSFQPRTLPAVIGGAIFRQSLTAYHYEDSRKAFDNYGEWQPTGLY